MPAFIAGFFIGGAFGRVFFSLFR